MSNLGYSVGYWEDNTLVVETSHIDWPFFDRLGTSQTKAIEILERFTLSEDERRLDYRVTILDPETFTGPATIEAHWLALGETIEPDECQVN